MMPGRFNLDDYEPVEDRLRKFWADHPDGRVLTELVTFSADEYIVMASIYRTAEDDRPWTTGVAHEDVTERGVNATSALENCETSAIGRALANAGYATRGKRPSREEMAKVQRREEAPELSEQEIADELAEWRRKAYDAADLEAFEAVARAATASRVQGESRGVLRAMFATRRAELQKA